MRTRLALLLIISVFIFSCRFQKKSKNIEDVETSYQKDTIDEINVKWEPSDSNMFTNLFTKTIALKSIFGNFVNGDYITDNYFSIGVNINGQVLINKILLNQDSFQEIMGKDNMFSVNTFIAGMDTIYRLIYRKSNISFRYPNHPLLILATIKDKEIDLKYNIKIGMTRDDFSRAFFNQARIIELDNIDTIEVSDILGEYKTIYVFKNNMLNTVETEIIDHWAIKQFKLDSLPK